MAIIQEFDLNMIPDASTGPVVVNADQYDKGTGRFHISLYRGDKTYTPSGATVKIQGTKPDKKGFSYNASISGNVVTANLTEQMTAVAGRVRVNVIVTEGTNRTGTFVFWLDVQATGLADDVDISETVLPEYINGAKQAAETAKTAAEEAKKAAESVVAKEMTNSVKGIGRPDGTTAEASNGIFSALGVVIPASVNTSATEYSANWLSGITPDTRQNYRVTVNGETGLYYWNGTKYIQIAGNGGKSSDNWTKVSGTVNGSTLVFTDRSINSDSLVNGPFIQGGNTGIQSVIQDETTITYTLSDNSSDGKKAYILVIEGEPASDVKIVSWADGTDEEIAAMVAAADAGKIDLSNYWNVGDERIVHLSAMKGIYEDHEEQDAIFTIMNKGGKTLSDGKECNFVVGLKNVLGDAFGAERGYMNSVRTNAGGWRDCERRAWCNDVFAESLPATLKAIFKKFKNQTGIGGGAAEGLYETVDLFSLPANVEVLGTEPTIVFSGEGSQFEYYKVSENRQKIYGINGTTQFWLLRSPRTNDSEYYQAIDTNGFYIGTPADNRTGIAPFGCI